MRTSDFILEPLWKLYKERLFSTPSTDRLFNFYQDEMQGLDLRGSARSRRQNLENYLRAYSEIPSVLIMGEAPGPWGCRFTGVPFTSERQLAEESVPFRGKRTSLNDSPHTERSASIFWDVMTPYFPHFLVWSTVPLHPHRPGEPLTIRTPSIGEVRAHRGLISDLLRIMEPDRILAVGRVAQLALKDLGCDFVPIRHPSHGGATEFRRGVQRTLKKHETLGRLCIPSS